VITAASAVVDERLVLKAIKPVEVARRRRTSDEERTAVFEDFSRYQKELSSLTAKAAVHMRNWGNSNTSSDEKASSICKPTVSVSVSASVANLTRLDDLTEQMAVMNQLLLVSASAPVLSTASALQVNVIPVTETTKTDQAIISPLASIKETITQSYVVVKPKVLKPETSIRKTPIASPRQPTSVGSVRKPTASTVPTPTHSTRVAAGPQPAVNVSTRKAPTTPQPSVRVVLSAPVAAVTVTTTSRKEEAGVVVVPPPPWNARTKVIGDPIIGKEITTPRKEVSVRVSNKSDALTVDQGVK